MKINSMYSDKLIFIQQLGEAKIERASHVEPQGTMWIADMGPSGGPILGPFPTRCEALRREEEWLISLLRAKSLFCGNQEPNGGENNKTS